MSTTTIGQGTRLLAEWALAHFWPCEECKGKRFLKSVDGYHNGPCPFCTTDEWLAALIADPHNAELWAVIADIWEERGDQRSEDLRMVARLLPLDVWPDTDKVNAREIAGWWINYAPNQCSNVGKLFPDLDNHLQDLSLFCVHRDIISALQALDSAIQSKLDTALQGVKHA